MTSAETQFNVVLHPQEPYGSLGWKAQDGHLDFHTVSVALLFYSSVLQHEFSRYTELMMVYNALKIESNRLLFFADS